MRIGLIADIHGNLIALDTVLADMAGRSVDRIVCLGDVAVLGPYPAAVIRRLREIGCPNVLGNTDAWVLGSAAAEPSASDSEIGRDLTAWTLEQLDADTLAWLRTAPPVLPVDLGVAGTLLCGHGSPRSHDEVISATTSERDLDAMFAGHLCDVYAAGHTHIRLLRETDQRLLLNPGSVGLPGVGPGTPDLPTNRDVRWADYAIVETTGGVIGVEIRRIPLDMGQMIASAQVSGMPHRDWWVGRWASAW